ncbi:unnamed protein product [Linum trigynum]|uniref:Remorin n=1 Tax=Linum trigynum TaxID=586398 RepID=A0AAV2DEL8_9ROSI
MAEEEAKKAEPECPAPAPPAADPPAAAAPAVEPPKDVAEEKSVIPVTPPSEDKSDKPDDSKAIVPVEKVAEAAVEEAKPAEGSINRDAVLARVETEKRTSLIKAWEEAEKSKAENKAQKKISAIESWENSKKANIEAELKKLEEQLEKKKAEYAEKMKNKIAEIHKQAEEKRAITEAKRGEELLKAEEIAAKYRATGTNPKNPLGYGCF